jgi:hypothetical protein
VRDLTTLFAQSEDVKQWLIPDDTRFAIPESPSLVCHKAEYCMQTSIVAPSLSSQVATDGSKSDSDAPTLAARRSFLCVSFSPYLHCLANNIKRVFFGNRRGIFLFLPTISYVKHPSTSGRFKIATYVSSSLNFKGIQQIVVRVRRSACRPSDTKPAHSCGKLSQP